LQNSDIFSAEEKSNGPELDMHLSIREVKSEKFRRPKSKHKETMMAT
jgi:hypothetical protein